MRKLFNRKYNKKEKSGILNRFFSPYVTFSVEDCDVNLLNRLREFKLKRINVVGDTLGFCVPLLNKKRVEQILQNRTYTVSEGKSIATTLSFVYTNLSLVICFVVVVGALLVLNNMIFRIQIQGLDRDEGEKLSAFLTENNVRSLTRKSRINDGLATAISSNFDFIAHTSMYIRGNTLVVSVHRTETPPMPSMVDIVSTHNAIITEMMVISGIAQVEIGQAVTAGQVLVAAQLQVGVTQGEPDDWGRPTFTPNTVPGYAMAIIRGRVSDSRAIIVQTEQEKDAAIVTLKHQIERDNDGINFDEITHFITQLEGGNFAVEVVASRVIDLVHFATE